MLISPSFEPMICDFGISRMLASSLVLSSSTQHGNLGGSVRWMATELLEPNSEPKHHTMETDVWAFGMTILVCTSEYFTMTVLV